MKNVRKWAEIDARNNKQEYEIDEFEGRLEVRTDMALFMIVAPHSGTKNRWMLRVAPIVSFDRWANSMAVEEFFDSEMGVCCYLKNHQFDIYKAMLRRLSDDYNEEYKQSILNSFREVDKMNNCVVLEKENSNEFENAMDDYLDQGYKVESTSCDGEYYKAILVLEDEED